MLLKLITFFSVWYFHKFSRLLIMIINIVFMFSKVLEQRMVLQRRTKISRVNLKNRCSSTLDKPRPPGKSESCLTASMKGQRPSRSFCLSRWWQPLNSQRLLLWTSWTQKMVSGYLKIFTLNCRDCRWSCSGAWQQNIFHWECDVMCPKWKTTHCFAQMFIHTEWKPFLKGTKMSDSE